MRDHDGNFYVGKQPRPKPVTLNEEWIAVQVAHKWNYKPWEYRALLPERIAELRAIYDVQSMIDRYYASEHERIMDRPTHNR